jgi:hypothetical protein
VNYLERVAEHRRLTVLRFLAEMPEGRSNSSILRDAAVELGVPSTRDQVRVDIAWLKEQGLVTAEELPSGLTVATITERGCDVARGAAFVPGVQRPTPRG